MDHLWHIEIVNQEDRYALITWVIVNNFTSFLEYLLMETILIANKWQEDGVV